MNASLVRVRLAFATQNLIVAQRHLMAASEEFLRRAHTNNDLHRSVQEEAWADQLHTGCVAIHEMARCLKEARLIFEEIGE